MVNKKLAKMLNEQIVMELYSGYLYLEMANYYAFEGLEGFAHWFVMQAHEEYSHAMIIRNFLFDNEEKVHMGKLDDPTTTFSDRRAPLVAALEHEKLITESINKIYSEAMDVKDFRTVKFLDWFIEEQAEEEASVNDLITKFDLFGSDCNGLYQLDQEFGARAATVVQFSLDGPV